jgi:methanogenic corrinoid protein MtbC1
MGISIRNSQEILELARHAIITLDDNEVECAVNEALELGINPIELIEKGFVEGMKEMGRSL